jgi:phospholipid transport system substrate-binding protein
MRSPTRARLGRAVFLLLAVEALAPASSAEPGGRPEEAVRQTLTRVMSVAQSEGARDQKLAALEDEARRLMDTDAMGRRALGHELSQQPPELQREFLDLFDAVIVRRYLRKLLLFRNPQFDFVGERVNGNTARVQTQILTTKDTFYVDYEMRRRNGAWLATDIVVEGVSISENYRSQFLSLLRTRSFEELLELMRRKARRMRDTSAL